MYNFALAFVLCAAVYIIGEVVSTATKAWIPSANACQGSSRKLNNLMTHCLIVGAAANRMMIDNDTVMEAADEIG